MNKIPFENGVKSKNAYITIDETNYDVMDAVYNGNTPLSAENLNQMQENIEESVVSVSSTEPTTSEKVWFKKGKNLIDYSKLTWGRDINDDGIITYYDDKAVISDYTPVNPNTSYIFSHALGTLYGKIYIFDKNKNYIGYTNFDNITSAFTTNENTYYVRVWVWYNVGTITPEIETWLQLEQGTVATEPEAYIEKEILVKNSNGVYEKFKVKHTKEYDLLLDTTFDSNLTTTTHNTINLQNYDRIFVTLGTEYEADTGYLEIDKNGNVIGSRCVSLFNFATDDFYSRAYIYLGNTNQLTIKPKKLAGWGAERVRVYGIRY